jgi:hypothetical protein
MTAEARLARLARPAVAIIASGPSARGQDLGRLKGRAKVVAIKESVDLCPWADMVYGCDPAWWRHRKGLPEFTGLKVAWSGAQVEFPDLLRVEIAKDRLGILQPHGVRENGPHRRRRQQRVSSAQPGGATWRLTGPAGRLRHACRGGVHWYGRNGWPMANNPDEANFRRWRSAFDAAAPVLREKGVDVVNAAPFSDLKSFRRMSLEAALRDWGLA